MSEQNTNCSNCGVQILQSTFQNNNGLCGKCHRQQHGERATPVQAIHKAILSGHFAIAIDILETNSHIRPKNFHLTLEHAERDGNIAALNFLRDRVLDLIALPKTVTPLAEAIRGGGLQTVRWILDNNAYAGEGMTGPLRFAISEGNAEIVRMLVEAGADVNATVSEHPLSPLDLAVRLGHASIVRYLRSKGAVTHTPMPKMFPIVSLTAPACVENTIDLRDDFPEFQKLIDRGVSAFVDNQNIGPRLPITRIDIRFTLTSAEVPMIYGYFDTEPNGNPDTGASKTYPWFEARCNHWAPANAVLDGLSFTIITAEGSCTANDEQTLNAAVGNFFVDLLKSARDRGAFARLLIAKQCYLGVSESEGCFGWPPWKERGPNNMVV